MKRWMVDHPFLAIILSCTLVIAANHTSAQDIDRGELDRETEVGTEFTDGDQFLGQISPTFLRDAYQERVNEFSGHLQANLIYARLPGKGGLDLVIQQSYSSNVWNRFGGPLTSFHRASANLKDHLGGNGWQFHMGRIVLPGGDPANPGTAVLPDGSTHPLYRSPKNLNVRLSQERWILAPTSDPAGYELTLTDGTVYVFALETGSRYLDPYGNAVWQCTGIRRPDSGNATIRIEYDENADLAKITDSYGRVVDFEYIYEPPPDYFTPARLSRIFIRKNDGDPAFQVWKFTYSEKGFGITQPNGNNRVVYELESLELESGSTTVDPWVFKYFDGAPALDNAPRLLENVALPTGGTIGYQYEAIGFDVGTEKCVVQFHVVTGKAIRDRDGSLISMWQYSYQDPNQGDPTPGSDDATTRVTILDPSRKMEPLRSEVTVFNGWGPYQPIDTTMWKIGRPKTRTITERGQVEVTTYEYERTDQEFSFDDAKTTNWLLCGSNRKSYTQYFSKPSAITTSVTRDGAQYTTLLSDFDDFGNVGEIRETTNGALQRTQNLSYWTNPALNILAGKPATVSTNPGTLRCNEYSTEGRLRWARLVTSGPTNCDGGIETEFTYYPASGNLESKKRTMESTKESLRVIQTDYSDYAYGSPKSIIVEDTNILFARDINGFGSILYSNDGRGSASDDTYRTHYTYDDLNRLTRIDPPRSNSIPTTVTYEPDWSTVIVQRDEHFVKYSFDGLGRLIEKEDRSNGSKGLATYRGVEIEYNAMNVKSKEQFYVGPNADFQPEVYSYDDLGRLTGITRSDGEIVSHRYSAGALGPRVAVTDEESETTIFEYEAFGSPDDVRLIEVEDALSNITTYEYNPSSSLLETIRTPISSVVRTFSYDDAGFLYTETHPESGTTRYQSDRLGHVRFRTTSDGNVTEYQYDNAGRMVTVDSPDNEADVTFGYNGASLRDFMSNGGGIFSMQYDENQFLEQKTSNIGGTVYTIGYEPDDLDRIDIITYPYGRKVKYRYDSRDWVSAVEDASGFTESGDFVDNITRYDTGAIDQIDYSNGVTSNFGLDSRYRVESISSNGPGGGVLNLGFIFDGVGNIDTWNDTLIPSNSRSFDYDALYRLTSATAPGLWGSLSFDYDEIGNRQHKTLTGPHTIVTTYGYDPQKNRLTSATTTFGDVTDASESFYYDVRGRTRQRFFSASSVSGTVTWEGEGLAGVTVTIEPGSRTTVTDGFGTYLIEGLDNGEYTVAADKGGYTFSPPSVSVTTNGGSSHGVDFEAFGTLFISGTVSLAPGTIGNVSEVSIAATAPGATSGIAIATTDAAGNYTVSGLGNEDYTVTPSKVDYSFFPVSRSIAIDGASVPGQDFQMFLETHEISGRITSDGLPLPAMPVTLNPGSISVHTDTTGVFRFTGVQDGTYTVEPSRIGYAFTPLSRTVTVSGGDETGIDFTAEGTLTLSGTVLAPDGAGEAGVLVTVSKGLWSWTATTATNGTYTVSRVMPGPCPPQMGGHTVVPSKSGATFDPASLYVTMCNSSQSGIDFQAGYTVAGIVTFGGGGLNGVRVTLGTGPNHAFTNLHGYYMLRGVANGSHTLTPTKAGYIFTPSERTVSVAGGSVSGQDFSAEQPNYVVSGRITSDGLPLAAIPVTLNPGAISANTDPTGAFRFVDIVNGTYTVEPSRAGFTFTPSTQSVTVNGGDKTGVDFTAEGTLTLSGTVLAADGTGEADVLVTVSKALWSWTATTATNGTYTVSRVMPGPCPPRMGGHTVVPSKSGATFDPASLNVTMCNSSQGGIDFQAGYTVSGVITNNDQGLSGAKVILDSGPNHAYTNSSGQYTIGGVSNGSHILTPTKTDYGFNPSSRTVSVAGSSVGGQNFTARLVTKRSVSTFESTSSEGLPQ